ncbi:SUMF1/EgtB/PvdO family nonheme iron enzyme, partial [Chitinispirillales bacterium ANBcel5]|uniref:formylglycine-generating enzyme family protein n=1 Tax=Cellulosispirillum alkaliphilum TaxID=3039283 RepID=UPI002A54AB09|nr:SUMF1/EgtB/PvdO family nonheme iron enzyme [Chitinispirillales bacterium ANBcel5]
MKNILLFTLLIIIITGCGSRKEEEAPQPVEPIEYSPSSPPEDMVYIPGGVFMMGLDGFAGNFYKQTSPRHPVSVSPFYISEHTVIIRNFTLTVNPNASFDRIRDVHLTPERTSFYDAVMFCNFISRRDGLEEVYEIKSNENGTITNIFTHI